MVVQPRQAGNHLALYLNPTLVLLLGLVLYQRHISRRQALGMALSYGGVMLVFGHEISFAGADAAWGAVLVFGSAVSYAVYLSFSGELVQRLGSLRLVGLATAVACALCIGQFVLLRPLRAALVAQSGMIGPMSTILMGVLLLGEPFTAWVVAGSALVVAGIFVFSSQSRRAH